MTCRPLTADARALVIAKLALGTSTRRVAAETGVSRTAVWRVSRGDNLPERERRQKIRQQQRADLDRRRALYATIDADAWGEPDGAGLAKHLVCNGRGRIRSANHLDCRGCGGEGWRRHEGPPERAWIEAQGAIGTTAGRGPRADAKCPIRGLKAAA